MHILTGLHQVQAEVAASRLRTAGISAQVVRDNEALLGVVGSSSIGTFSVSIADSDAREARAALHIRDTSTSNVAGAAGSFTATAILMIVVGLAFALALVALYAWNVIGH